MANAFYNPSGNPGQGSQGLSAIVRAEFEAIAAGFAMVAQITTTGEFATVFNQQGNFTFTLPDADGTLATTADVGVETTRAEAAEAANATAIATETTNRITAVSDEATTRAAADTVNATAIATETTDRTTAISDEATTRATADATNATAISDETTRAETAEAANAAAITAETTRAEAAEAVNATAITNETTRAEAAEAANATAIATETTRAEAAEAANATVMGSVQGFRNRVINGGMTLWQRGASFTNPVGVYTADTFFLENDGSSGTLTVSQVTVTDANVLAAGPQYAMQYALTGSPHSGTGRFIGAVIEDPRTFAGHTVRLTWWARATSGTGITITPDIASTPGTGGSPAGAYTNNGSAVTLTSTFQQFSQTFALPAASTITPGTNADGYLETDFNLPVNKALTVQITGVQLEIDTGAVTAFEVRPPGVELALAQRYYQTVDVSILAYANAGVQVGQTVGLPVTMRISPTIASMGTVTHTNCAVPTVSGQDDNGHIIVYSAATALGAVIIDVFYSLDADL